MPWRAESNVGKGGPDLHVLADKVRVKGRGAVVSPLLMLLPEVICCMHSPSTGLRTKRKQQDVRAMGDRLVGPCTVSGVWAQRSKQ